MSKKPAKPWKPVPVAVQVARHKAAAAKAKHPAHHPRAAHAKTARHARKRAWTPDGDVALCAARAVATSLNLALGMAVPEADVLAWYWQTATDPDDGQTILDALSAAFRLAGASLAYSLQVPSLEPVDGPSVAAATQRADPAAHSRHVLILGVDWPEPHAVAELDGVWWSWGQPYEPWTDQISEAWAVTWQP